MSDPHHRLRRLLVLPGMDGTGRLLQPFAEAMGAEFRTTVLDYPTHEPLSYQALIDRIAPQLPQREPFVLMGESFGGPIAIALAQQAPAMLRGLVLAVTFGTAPRTPLLPLTKVLPVRWMLSQPVPCWLAGRIMLGPKPPKGTVGALCRVMDTVSPAVLAKRFDEVRQLRLARLPVEVPALYLQASGDLLLPPSVLDDLRPLVPDLQVHRLVGPHLLLDTAPQTCAELVREFMRQLDHKRSAA